MADELNFDLAFGEIKEDAPQADNFYEYGTGEADGGDAGDGDGGDDRGSFYVANDWVEDEPIEQDPDPEQDEGFELPLRAYADRALNDSIIPPARSPSPRDGDSTGGEEEL